MISWFIVSFSFTYLVFFVLVSRHFNCSQKKREELALKFGFRAPINLAKVSHWKLLLFSFFPNLFAFAILNICGVF